MNSHEMTETIAHFIGMFDLILEEARARETYEQFRAEQVVQDEAVALESIRVTIKASYTFEGFDPNIRYTPLPPELVTSGTFLNLTAATSEVFVPWFPLFHSIGLGVYPASGRLADVVVEQVRLPTIDPPGQVAVFASQRAVLSDDDMISLGSHGLTFHPSVDTEAQLDALFDMASALVPLPDVDPPGSGEEMIAFTLDARDALLAFEPPADGPANVFVMKAATMSGSYVNGELVATLPDYATYRPPEDEEAEPEDEDGAQPSVRIEGQGEPSGADFGIVALSTSSSGSGSVGSTSSIELHTGENTLINSVSLTSNWLAASVTAVMGDHREINAIVQANVRASTDSITSVFGMGAASEDDDIAFNMATFERIDPRSEESGGTSSASSDFPSYWTITQVTGDFLITSWIEQLIFVTDNDVAVLSSTGNRTEIIAGQNTSLNDFSLAELGYHYDLIIVGGSVYDANFIYQLNVLLDEDVIGAVDGAAPEGTGAIQSGGNLLWNEAYIVNVGAADRFEALPGSYRELGAKLAAGDKSGSNQVLNDPSFLGLEGLRVLYITGDIINLNFIKQVNVLGDSDQVALARNAVESQPATEWTVSTGDNTLVNFAGIADADAMGPTYVGGEIYSDEILIQADLISASPDLESSDPDALVTEAVAFLGDDLLAPDGADLGGATPLDPLGAANSAQADPMHTMIS